MSGRTRLGVIFGGRSLEHEVSVVSAMELLADADPTRFETVPFGVTKQGLWLTPQETQTRLDRAEPLFEKRIEGDVPPLLERSDVLRELRGVDVVFPLVHGVNGEDGTLQGMLEMFGVPYVGCGVEASAIGMDKAQQKKLFLHAGLNVARYLTVFSHEWDGGESGVGREIERALGYPAFVKPSNGGSSVGVSKVRSREDLGEAMRAAFDMDRKVVVEEAVAGREVDCGVIGNDDPEASPVGEVIHAGDFYDYRQKYLDDSAQIVAPAELTQGTSDAVRADAVTAYRALDCAGFARLDFFVRPDGQPVVNEINTLPGFRAVSMFPRLWAAAGVTYRELVNQLVELALERFRGRRLRDASS